ncbi:B12-binding domain-containing radical SAM protein [candidate division KSB1 bacterium]|nr:B12-binding domain-containing radical SAM protein [candidate division KSB1 bacterium]
MKITLISLDRELYCIGVRTLSACLRQAGHEVQVIFMVPATVANARDKFRAPYPASVLQGLRDRCADSDIIGISLMANQMLFAIQITEFLKSQAVRGLIVWGGIEPTVEPEVCLEYADCVCLGEGEAAIVELAANLENETARLQIQNFWFKTPDGIVRNPVRPFIQNLDELPFPDYSCQNHWIASQEQLEPLTIAKFARFSGERFRNRGTGILYMFMTSRGCPYNCSFCCNAVYRELYPNQKHLRFRSVRNVLDELKQIQREVAPIEYVYMVDDNFTSRPMAELKAFCEQYKAEIGLPFFCQISPLTITAERMELLLAAGCTKITMGVETASERIAAMYNRSRAHKALPNAIALVEKYRSQMPNPPTYQFIIDNPYETLDETLSTLRMAASFPRPWHNPIFSLMFFPGLPLSKKAMEDGYITDKFTQIYGRNWRAQSKPFFQFWIRLYRANIHPGFLRFLLQKWIAWPLTTPIADSIWKWRIFRWLWEKIK